MTNPKWDEMSPRERDALVATEVMGWERSDDPTEIGAAFIRGGPLWTISDHGGLLVARKGHPGPWSPTTDISAAWEVVEEMRETGRWLWCSESRDGWTAVFSSHQGNAPLHPKGASPNAPEAICLAALRAKGIEV